MAETAMALTGLFLTDKRKEIIEMCDGNLSALREYEHEEYLYEIARLKLPKCDYCEEPIEHGYIFNDVLVCDDEDCVQSAMLEFVEDDRNRKSVEDWIVYQVFDGEYDWFIDDIKDAADNQALYVTEPMVYDALENGSLDYDEFLFDYFYAHSEEVYPDSEF